MVRRSQLAISPTPSYSVLAEVVNGQEPTVMSARRDSVEERAFQGRWRRVCAPKEQLAKVTRVDFAWYFHVVHAHFRPVELFQIR